MNWNVVRPKDDNDAWSIEDDDGITICELSFTGGDEVRVARLIAAAPNLRSAVLSCAARTNCPTSPKPWIIDWIDEPLTRVPREKS